MLGLYWSMKLLAAVLLAYIAYRDYKTHLIVRWQGLLFLFLALDSVVMVNPTKALVLTAFAVVISLGLYLIKAIRWFDGVILTGAVLLVENIWVPFGVAVIMLAAYVRLAQTGRKPKRWVPYTPFILLYFVLWMVWEVWVIG